MKILTDECGQPQYRQFIVHNKEEGWKNRDRNRNICDGESWKPTTDENMIGSYAASSVPAMMLAIAPQVLVKGKK